jgi:predicted ATPase
MAKLKVRNVGPIKSGYNSPDGFMEIKGVTVFIGNQGSGKSTIAKLFSTLSWIEKALIRGDFTDKFVVLYNRFKNKHLAYQNISNYLNDDSYIEYIGSAFRFLYKDNQFSVHKIDQSNSYSFPKIMYIPAERNFVSSVDKPDLIKRLPLPLYTFMDEYEEAKQQITDAVNLPIGNVSFEYKKHSKKSFLIGDGYNIELLEASSGFQSMVPMILVTRYLSEISKNKVHESRKEISRDEGEKIRKTVSLMFQNNSISEDVMRAVLERLSSQFKYQCFINVVEEPEQNLFPTSQKEILFELLKVKNENSNNKLIMTTHSPYLINYLTLCVKAESVYKTLKEKGYKLSDPQLTETNDIVPMSSTVKSNDLVIYELDEKDGCIRLLPDYKGLPSDENKLNDNLEDSNELFAQLLEIQQGL